MNEGRYNTYGADLTLALQRVVIELECAHEHMGSNRKRTRDEILRKARAVLHEVTRQV